MRPLYSLNCLGKSLLIQLAVGLSLFLPLMAQAYSPSFTLERKSYSGFEERGYAYSSLFRSGRDDFHFLDLAYTQAEYITDDEVGNSVGYNSIYRFANRQRWHRLFKPSIFISAGLARRSLTDRHSLQNNILQGSLGDATITEALVSVGGGYLWEVRQMVIGFSVAYGYDWGYREGFVSPAFVFSYQL